MDELAGLLGRQRRLLEVLLFKLVETRHLLITGETRFLPWAAREVEGAAERAREVEAARTEVVRRLAGELHLPASGLTLERVVTRCPEPYRTIFAEHRRGLLDLTAEIEGVRQANRALAACGLCEVIDALTAGAEGGRRGILRHELVGALPNHAHPPARVRLSGTTRLLPSRAGPRPATFAPGCA